MEKSVSIGLIPVWVSTSPHSPDRSHAHVTACWLCRLTRNSVLHGVLTAIMYAWGPSTSCQGVCLPSALCPLWCLFPISAASACMTCVCMLAEKTALDMPAHHSPFSKRCTSLHSPSPGLWERSKQPLSREEARDSSPKRPTCFLSMQTLETGQFLHCLSFSLF